MWFVHTYAPGSVSFLTSQESYIYSASPAGSYCRGRVYRRTSHCSKTATTAVPFLVLMLVCLTTSTSEAGPDKIILAGLKDTFHITTDEGEPETNFTLLNKLQRTNGYTPGNGEEKVNLHEKPGQSPLNVKDGQSSHELRKTAFQASYSLPEKTYQSPRTLLPIHRRSSSRTAKRSEAPNFSSVKSGKHRTGKRRQNTKRKSRTRRKKKTVVPPKFMLDLYHTYKSVHQTQPRAEVIRGFSPVEIDPLQEARDAHSVVRFRSLHFNITNLLVDEQILAAELRFHLTAGRAARYWRKHTISASVRICVLLFLGDELEHNRSFDDNRLSGRGRAAPVEPVPVGFRSLGCRVLREGRFDWQTFNVTEAIVYWKTTSHRAQQLDVRIAANLHLGALKQLSTSSRRIPERGATEAMRKSPMSLLDICTNRLSQRPLLVVYSEERNDDPEMEGNDIDTHVDGDDDGDQALPTSAVSIELKRKARLKARSRKHGRSSSDGKDAGKRPRRSHPSLERSTNGNGDEIIDMDLEPEILRDKLNKNTKRILSERPLTDKQKQRPMESDVFDPRQLSFRRFRREATIDIDSSHKELTRARGRRLRLKRGKASRRRSRRQCKRAPMFVNFADINWHKWVIAPKGYQAYQCSGRCDFPLSDLLTPTKHAIVQSLVHINTPDRAARSCCVPTRLDPISILYIDERNVVTYKYRYQGMMVGECGCR